MKRAIALADNCIDVYYKLDRYYLTGNSIDFALNYKEMGGDVTEMTILGNDVFAFALEERLRERGIPLRVLARADRPTGMATMDIVDGDKKHLRFAGNAMEEIVLSPEDLDFIKGFDIVYAERWARIDRYIAELKQPGQVWVYDFSKRLDLPVNDLLLPYLDYAFFSYEQKDDFIREFIKGAWQPRLGWGAVLRRGRRVRSGGEHRRGWGFLHRRLYLRGKPWREHPPMYGQRKGPGHPHHPAVRPLSLTAV